MIQRAISFAKSPLIPYVCTFHADALEPHSTEAVPKAII